MRFPEGTAKVRPPGVGDGAAGARRAHAKCQGLPRAAVQTRALAEGCPRARGRWQGAATPAGRRRTSPRGSNQGDQNSADKHSGRTKHQGQPRPRRRHARRGGRLGDPPRCRRILHGRDRTARPSRPTVLGPRRPSEAASDSVAVHHVSRRIRIKIALRALWRACVSVGGTPSGFTSFRTLAPILHCSRTHDGGDHRAWTREKPRRVGHRHARSRAKVRPNRRSRSSRRRPPRPGCGRSRHRPAPRRPGRPPLPSHAGSARAPSWWTTG